MFVVLLAGLQSIPELYEAASGDVQCPKEVDRITILLVWPMISIVIVIRLDGRFSDFRPSLATDKRRSRNEHHDDERMASSRNLVNMNIGYGLCHISG